MMLLPLAFHYLLLTPKRSPMPTTSIFEYFQSSAQKPVYQPPFQSNDPAVADVRDHDGDVIHTHQ